MSDCKDQERRGGGRRPARGRRTSTNTAARGGAIADTAMPPLRGGVFAAQEAPGGSGDGRENTLRIVAWPEQPLAVNQSSQQTVGFKGDVPVCIRVCEPICARSDYTIGITFFDRPVATITLSGTTRIENCGGGTPPQRETWPPRSPAAEAAPGTIAETARGRKSEH